jgi:integrase/recombinase XerD
MGQAKTLSQSEIKQILGSIALGKHAARNRAMFFVTTHAGLRVGEVAALRYGDVVDDAGRVKSEFRLLPEMTKGNHARTVFVSDRLLKELQVYVDGRTWSDRAAPLFYTQKRAGFTPNTLAQVFMSIYRAANMHGASSHSGRRTFITTLANKGIGVRLLASLAGHQSVAVTMRYIDCNDDMKRNAVNLV